jgi:hypothetical protein
MAAEWELGVKSEYKEGVLGRWVFATNLWTLGEYILELLKDR